MQKIYEKEGFITVTFYEKPMYILFNWSKFSVSLAEMQELHMKTCEFVQNKKVKTLIGNTSKTTGVLFNECVEWFGKEQIPRLSKAGLKRFVTVVPHTALSRHSSKSWQQAVEGIDLYNCDTLEDAMNLIIE